MAVFRRKDWKRRLSEFPSRRKLVPTNEANVYDVARNEGKIFEEGDPFIPETMNDLEERLQEAIDTLESHLGGTINYTILEPPTPIVEPAHALLVARQQITAATDGDGNVLFAGGIVSTNLLERFDVDGNRLELRLSISDYGMPSATDGNGSVWLGMGASGNSPSPNIDRFNTNGFRTTFQASIGRNYSAAATDGHGSVLFGGGNRNGILYTTIDKFDIDGVRTTLELSAARYRLAATTDGNGSVWFAGGQISTGSTGPVTEIIDKFDIDGVRTTLELSAARCDPAAATDGNGNVWFAGGRTSLGASDMGLTVIDKFDIDGVRTTLQMSIQRAGSSKAITDGNGDVIIFGGASGADEVKVDRFDVNGNQTTFTLSPAERTGISATTDGNGNVWFAGGLYSANNYLSMIEIYYTKKVLPVLVGSKYKFKEHEAEQIATKGTINVKMPNEGYISIRGSVTI